MSSKLLFRGSVEMRYRLTCEFKLEVNCVPAGGRLHSNATCVEVLSRCSKVFPCIDRGGERNINYCATRWEWWLWEWKWRQEEATKSRNTHAQMAFHWLRFDGPSQICFDTLSLLFRKYTEMLVQNWRCTGSLMIHEKSAPTLRILFLLRSLKLITIFIMQNFHTHDFHN